MPIRKPLLEIVLPYGQQKYKGLADEAFEAAAVAILGEVKKMERSSGMGRWKKAWGYQGRPRNALQGISKYLEFWIVGNSLEVSVKPSGRTRYKDFVYAHHQQPGSVYKDIYPRKSKSLYLPMTKRAKAVSAREAFKQSSRFGGALKEGQIDAEGELWYYDPLRPAGTKNRLRKGFPDFLWVAWVRLPARALFDRRKIRKIAREAILTSLKGGGHAKSKVKLRVVAR